MKSHTFIICQKMSICLPFEMIQEIDRFLKWDITSFDFIRHVNKKTKKDELHQLFDYCMNRKNGFCGQEDENTEDPHWVFGCTWLCPYEKISLQAINCSICGNYIVSRNESIPFSIRCNCNNLR